LTGRDSAAHDLPVAGQDGAADHVLIGESYVGVGAEAAHVNTILGSRSGVVGAAWTTSLAMPRAGHIPFITVLTPGIPVKPLTLFVNKAPVAADRHANITWGAAQAGVAGGVADAVAARVISASDAESLLLIVAVWVDPKAADEDLVYANNRAATHAALAAGVSGGPSLAEMLAAAAAPANPFYSSPPARGAPSGSGADGARGA
jgi:5,6,7,8-tetrahydromethanopterin hydro-lyase